MSKKKYKSPLEKIVVLIAIFAAWFIRMLIRLCLFMYDVITFYTSKYKSKSGNNFFKTYFDKGNYGEFQLYRKVIRVFGKASVLTNIYLDNVNTEMTEIDVLAVSKKRIYIFEMKNYSGYIFGSQTDKNWTQVLNKRTKNKFYNPLKQNFAHTKAVQSYLDIDNDLLVPIVVFSNRSKLSKINVGEKHHVMQFSKAIRLIKSIEKNSVDRLSEEIYEGYLIKLIDRCHMSEEVKLKHINEVKALVDASS